MTVSAPATVRMARADDAWRIAQLSAELGYPADCAEIAERLHRLAASAADAVLVAEADALVVGWAHVCQALSVEYPPLAELRGLVVDATLRSRGIGAALLGASERWAVARGLQELRVRSQVVRERAHRFYLDRGYTERKRQVVFVKPLPRIDDA
jgi:GNAT superfamily N-acetyltransferase